MITTTSTHKVGSVCFAVVVAVKLVEATIHTLLLSGLMVAALWMVNVAFTGDTSQIAFTTSSLSTLTSSIHSSMSSSGLGPSSLRSSLSSSLRSGLPDNRKH
ncbi:hypothetical protein DICA1_E18492 [Diutina catenulata]